MTGVVLEVAKHHSLAAPNGKKMRSVLPSRARVLDAMDDKTAQDA